MWAYFPQKKCLSKIFIFKSKSHAWKILVTFSCSLKDVNDTFCILFQFFYSIFFFCLKHYFSNYFYLKVISAFNLLIVTVNLKNINCRCSKQYLQYSQKEVLREKHSWHRDTPSSLVTNLTIACFRATRSQHSWWLASFIFLPLEKKR